MKVLDMADSAAAYGGGEAPNQTQKLYFDHQPLNPIATESSHGAKTMLNFGGVKRSGNLVFSSFDQEEFGDEYLDEYLNQQEKKRRLTVDQVQFLERSFEADNKLEPERKTQLANELGLQPRQIAVWFQNRRARFKTKRVETDYETLHARYESLKTDYDALLKENDKLKAEVLRLKQGGLGEDTTNADSQMIDSREVHEEVMPREGNACVISADEEYKNEEQSSARSEVTTNVESPRLTDGINSPLLESHVTSHVFDTDYSDSSQNGENHLHDYPRFEDAHDHHPPLSSFYYGFSVEDHHTFNFW